MSHIINISECHRLLKHDIIHTGRVLSVPFKTIPVLSSLGHDTVLLDLTVPAAQYQYR